MKELRALKRVFRLWNLSKTYDRVLSLATTNGVQVLNERQFYNMIDSKQLDLSNPHKSILVLKHDVDRNLKPILKAISIEKKFGVSSTFHVRADEKQYLIKDAYNVLNGQDVAFHLVNDIDLELKKISEFFPDIIGVSTHGGHESKISFSENLLKELSTIVKYISDGLLRPRPIQFKHGMLLITIDSADIYFENLIKKMTMAIEQKKIMILNTHVELFMPKYYLKKQFQNFLKGRLS